MEQNNYCLTLTHHGIKGMKWGVRRTAAQLGHKVFKRKQKPKSEDDAKAKAASKPARKKTMREMTDAELRAAIERARLEQTYAQLRPQTSSKGKRFISAVMDKVVVPAATEAGKNLMRDKLTQMGKKYLGIEDGAESAFQKLKRQAEISENKAKIMNNKDKAAAYDDEYGGGGSKKDTTKAKNESGSDSKPNTGTSAKTDKTKTNTAKTDKKETYDTSYEAPKKSNNSDSSSTSSSKKSQTMFYDASFVDKTEYASTRSSGSKFVSGLLSSGSNSSSSSASSTGRNYIAGLLAAPDDNR